MAKPLEVTELNFEETVLKASQPVLVDFWAPWCGPCRMVSPIVEELADEYEGRMGFAKLNTDDSPAVAMKYQIQSIPTLMIFRGGQPVGQIIGFRPKRELKKHLDEVLA